MVAEEKEDQNHALGFLQKIMRITGSWRSWYTKLQPCHRGPHNWIIEEGHRPELQPQRVLAALKVTEIMSILKKPASTIFNLYTNFPQIKINLTYDKISKNFLKYLKNINSKKIKDKNIRSLIRLSGTEPLIRILVEGKDLKKVQAQAKIIENDIRINLGK